MPRFIFKCPHAKGGGKSSGHLKNHVNYIATREGVEKLQQQTHRPTATVHLTNYVEYISQRPNVQKLGSHGLFTGTDDPLVLSRIAEEVSRHRGTVWLPILSLRREDAARLGYDRAEQWRALLTVHAPDIARAMKIAPENFRWYAAFHDEGTHPHVHMVCYSTDTREGFLTKQGIEQIKSMIANQIFRQELTELYADQSRQRDALIRATQESLHHLTSEMQSGTLENEKIAQLLLQLADQLKTVKGKKQYGYLRAPLKSLVNEITDELATDPRVAEAYDLWHTLRENILHTYRDDLPARQPLSQQKELRRIKNIIIEEAAQLGQSLSTTSPPTPTTSPHTPPPSPHATPQPPILLHHTTRLLHHLSKILSDTTPQPPLAPTIRITDSKLRQKLRDKRLALGHKPDDHEPHIS